MRAFLYRVALIVPSFTVGITAGRFADSLHAQPPVPLATAILAAVAAVYGLDFLFSNLLAHRAARRG